VDAQDAPDQLHAEFRIAARAHRDESEGPRSIETQSHRHFKNKYLAPFVIGEGEQAAVGFIRGVNRDLLFGEAESEQPCLHLLDTLRF